MGLPGPQACLDMTRKGNEILGVSLVTTGQVNSNPKNKHSLKKKKRHFSCYFTFFWLHYLQNELHL